MPATRPTWIVVADGAKARVLQYHGPDETPEPVAGGVFEEESLSNQELVTNKRGRVFNSADGSRSAMAYTTEPHRQQKDEFAKQVSDFLGNHANDFERLFVAAAPRTLGDLRKHLPNQVSQKVSMELDKDLTNLPDHELPQHFGKLINSTIQP